MTMRVHVLTYTHRHGEDVSVYASEAVAQKSIADIVDTYWDELFPNVELDSVPTDERVDRYFDASHDEDYSIEELEVQGLDESTGLTLFHQIRSTLGWTGTVFVEGDITGMLDPDNDVLLEHPDTGDRLDAERIAALTPQIVEKVQDSYAWQKAMQDRLSEIGNEILFDAVASALREVTT